MVATIRIFRRNFVHRIQHCICSVYGRMHVVFSLNTTLEYWRGLRPYTYRIDGPGSYKNHLRNELLYIIIYQSLIFLYAVFISTSAHGKA